MSNDFVISDSSNLAIASERRAALRIAFGVTACFAVVEAFDWDATFLAPLFAANMLVKLMLPPSFSQGLFFVIWTALSTGIVLVLTAALLFSPVVLILALALTMYIAFYAHRRGAPELVTLLPQISTVTIPVIAVVSPDASGEFAFTLVSAGVVALLAVWAAHAAFPTPFADATASSNLGRAIEPTPDAARNALFDTLVLLPALTWFILDGTEVALVVLIVIVTLLRLSNAEQSLRGAFGLVLANLIGGLAAAIVYSFVILADSYLFFVATCLAMSLVFAGRIVTAGDQAPVYAVGLATFILILGLGMVPLVGSSGELFVDRLINVLLASAYAIGGLSLVSRWRHLSDAQEP